MNLASVQFACFAGVLLFLYYRIPRKGQWVLLMAGGMIFYLSAGAEYLIFLLFTSITTWLTTGRMEKNKETSPAKSGAKEKNRRILTLCLVSNFAVLTLCKACLTEPFAQMAKGSPLSFLTLGLPMGISFYMFQTMGYAIDVYRGTAKGERSFWRFHLFASYFPLLVQGPICRYSQLAPQLFQPHPYDKKTVSFGLQRMLWGYFKKLVIADRIAPAVAALQAPEHTGMAFLLLTVFYAVQLYADFTGGIDVVLGLSQALGISLPENFNRPFFSKNIAEYWRRWHISLGEWMKNYVFFPISVSRPMRRLSKAARNRFGHRGKRVPVYIATIATWFVTGIWHGLTPNFVLWGMLNCFVILLSEELTPLYARFHSRFHLKEKGWYGGFEMLRMFLLMNLIRACDLFPDPGDYFRRLGSLFTAPDFRILWDGTLLELGLKKLDYGILLCGVGLMLGVSVFQEKRGSVREYLRKGSETVRFLVLFALFLVILLMGSYGVGYEASSFIYNQF